MRKKFVLLFLFILCCTSCYLFRQAILAKMLQRALAQLIPIEFTTMHIEKLVWKEGKIYALATHGLGSQAELKIDGVQWRFSGEGATLFSPKVTIVHPELVLFKGANQKATRSAATIGLLGVFPNIEVQNGVLQIEDHRLYFALRQPTQAEPWAGLSFSQDPGLFDAPFFTANFRKQGEDLQCQFNMKEMECLHFYKLASLFIPLPLQPDSFKGHLQWQAEALVQKNGELKAFSGELFIEDAQLVDSSLQFDVSVDSLKMKWGLPNQNLSRKLPLWQQMVSQLSLKGATFQCASTWGLAQVNAEFFSGVDREPVLKIDGKLLNGQKSFQFIADGKGGANQDHSFWIECAMRISESVQKQCSLHLSLCHPQQETFVLQADVKNIYADEWALLSELMQASLPEIAEAQLLQGKVSATFLAWFEKGHFVRLDMQQLLAESAKVRLAQRQIDVEIDSLKAVGKLQKNSRKFEGEIALEMKLPLNPLVEQIYSHQPKSNFQADGSITKEKSAAWEPVSITGLYKCSGDRSDISGTVTFLESNDALQFGIESKNLLPLSLAEIHEGWIRSSSLQKSSYLPLVQLFTPALTLDGQLDLFGTLQDGELKLSLQTDQLQISHSKLLMNTGAIGQKDPMLLATEGRAQLIISPSEGTWKLELPLNSAEILFNEDWGALHKVKGKCLISKENDKSLQMKGQISSARLVQRWWPAMDELSFDWSFSPVDGQLTIGHCKGAIDYFPDWTISCDSFVFNGSQTEFEMLLLYKQRQFASTKLAALTSDLTQWRIQCEFSDAAVLKGDLAARLVFQKDAFRLEAQGTACEVLEMPFVKVGLAAEIQKDASILASMQLDGHLFQVALAKEKESVWQVKEARWESKDLLLRLAAAVELDWSAKAAKALIQARVDRCFGYPLNAQAKPFQIAFSQELGLVSSAIDWSFGESRCFLEHMEYVKASDVWSGRNLHLLLSSDVVQTLQKNHYLPPFFAQILKLADTTFGARMNFQLQKNGLQLKGSLDQTDYQFELSAQPLFTKKTCEADLCLRDEKSNEQMKMHFEILPDHEVVWQKFEGSMGAVELKLKRDKQTSSGAEVFSGKMKGEMASLTRFFSKDFYPLREEKNRADILLEGHFIHRDANAEFVGKCEARDFAFMGYKLKKMDANIHFAPERLMVQNLLLKDDGLQLEIEEAVCFKESAESWMYDIPSVRIKGFKPSLLSELEGAEKSFKPFFVKQGMLEQVHGQFGQLRSLQAHGNFQFVTSMRSAASFDASTEALQSMSVDPRWLIPLSGEAGCELRDGKCWITSLKGAQSEGKKLAFSLMTPSHLDLEGNIFFNFTVEDLNKHQILPFALKLRGNLEHPLISIVQPQAE